MGRAMRRMVQKQLNIGIQLGTQTWVAAIAGPSMFANLSENTFADVQAVLFPRYECTYFFTKLYR